MARRLADPPYLAFPLKIEEVGGELANRSRHIRDQIVQVLHTLPGERIFRPDFGAGIKTLVFEPNAEALWEIAKKRLMASLAQTLKGEVDPGSLELEVTGDNATLNITIRYTLATIGQRQEVKIPLGNA